MDRPRLTLPAACPVGVAECQAAHTGRGAHLEGCGDPCVCSVQGGSAQGEGHLPAENRVQAGRAPEELENPGQMRFQSRGAGTCSLPCLSKGYT